MSIQWTSPDGLWGIIQAKDLPPDIARSKTRSTIAEAENAAWDPGNVAPVGPKSQNDYVKVRISDLPQGYPGAKPGRPQVVLSPGNYTSGKKKFIPDYPHVCPTCGGKMLWLFTTQEHEGGKSCPGSQKPQRRAR